MLINIGRLLMLCVWGFLILNLVHPFPRPLNIFVNVALIFTVLMHGMQLALLKSTLPKSYGFSFSACLNCWYGRRNLKLKNNLIVRQQS